MKYWLGCFLFAICFCSLNAQEAYITFSLDKDCEILVYEPLDGVYNDRVSTQRLVVEKGKAVTCRTKVDGFSSIHCKFTQLQQSCDVIAFPGDRIEVVVNTARKLFDFRGDNGKGNRLLRNIVPVPFLNEYLIMRSLFQKAYSGERILAILSAVNDSLNMDSKYRKIQELSEDRTVNPQFASVLRTQVKTFYDSYILVMLAGLLNGDGEHRLTPTMINETKAIVDSILKSSPLTEAVYKCMAGHLYAIKYAQFSEDSLQVSLGTDLSIFGPYKNYFKLDRKFQPAMIGSACMTQLKYDSKEMDLAKVQAFLNKEFPDSQYTTIVNEQLNKYMPVSEEGHYKAIFIQQQVNTIHELVQQAGLEGKYLYIDLWASWCMPCRGELSHSKEVHQLLKQYPNVVPLYISIDKEKQESTWKKLVDHYQLSGYHLRASSALEEDIKQHVFETDAYEIPRYALIAPDGTVLHRDLPRPSELDLLKDELNQLLKNDYRNN